MGLWTLQREWHQALCLGRPHAYGTVATQTSACDYCFFDWSYISPPEMLWEFFPVIICSIPVLTTGQRQRDVPGLSHILEQPWLPKHSHRIRLTLHSKLRISILQERGRQQEHVLSCVSWKPSNLSQTGQWELHSFPIFVLVCFKARFPWGAHALLSPLEWAGPWFHFSCRPGCLSL